MQQFRLIPHPTTPCEFIGSIVVKVVQVAATDLAFAFIVHGDIGRLKIAPPGTPVRADALWRETCFEAFTRAGNSAAYCEFNFAPSGAWAGYRFEDYRLGMRAIEPMQPPVIVCTRSTEHLQVDVRLNVPAPGNELRIALAAVLQDLDGQVSFWALAHTAGKPDFHAARGFVAALHQ